MEEAARGGCKNGTVVERSWDCAVQWGSRRRMWRVLGRRMYLLVVAGWRFVSKERRWEVAESKG